VNNLDEFSIFRKNLATMAKTHAKKNHDYAGDEGSYFNFEYAAAVAEPFTGVDKVFATMIGIKLARMAVLKKGIQPLNESTEDSHKDSATYMAIWWAYYCEQEKKNERGRRLRTRVRERQRKSGGSGRSTSKSRTRKPAAARRTNRKGA
jgi:hypothetical protein